MKTIQTIADIVAWRMCVGCGACAFACPKENIRLVDIVQEGIRPQIMDPGQCGSCRECLDVCPSHEADYSSHRSRPGILPELLPTLGPILEIWEGHATDPEIRFQGSSGGALTALALYALEGEKATGVLHIGQNPLDPIRNQTRLSRSREELMAFAGSRYAPASACDRLDLIESAPSPCVFIGQPAEVTALRKAQKLRPTLDHKVCLALSFFCAGSPSTQGTIELLKKLGVAPDAVRNLRYRGRGWPGMFSTQTQAGELPREHQTYQQSWAFLQSFRPYATHLQPDGSGEDADISCGDPWYRPVVKGEPGSSLLVVRTERGREFIRKAMEAKYLALTPTEPMKLVKSQENLIGKRRNVWGRRLAFKTAGIPVTRLIGLPLFRLWLGLPSREKLKSTLGTLRRIVDRKYYRTNKVDWPAPIE